MKKNYTINRVRSFAILLMLFVYGGQVFAQAELPREILDDARIVIDRALMQKGPAWRQRTSDLLTTQVNVDQNGNDILGDAANEPSIAIDPTNPDRIVIGWRQFDTTESNFRQAGYGYSEDGGKPLFFPEFWIPGSSDQILYWILILKGTSSTTVFKEILPVMSLGSPMAEPSGRNLFPPMEETSNGCVLIEVGELVTETTTPTGMYPLLPVMEILPDLSMAPNPLRIVNLLQTVLAGVRWPSDLMVFCT
ncbi:hypothetical protein [Aureitalea marina]|uniref:Uncharacterized protein n=1 Tax=Aureitalea marina TaxID=930804 RepID=A0A2S7KP76_9FLAO|nr:hypothetical protein [Aureitalea marina]PQB04407.1 hypothetical protein BST85_05470 [Aureitalea marina]